MADDQALRNAAFREVRRLADVNGDLTGRDLRAGVFGRVQSFSGEEIARFGTANEFSDWDTALHGFTYANALHRLLGRVAPECCAFVAADDVISRAEPVLSLQFDPSELLAWWQTPDRSPLPPAIGQW